MHDLKVTGLRPGKRQLLLLSLESTETHIRVGKAQVHGICARVTDLFIASKEKMFKKRSFDDPRPISLK